MQIIVQKFGIDVVLRFYDFYTICSYNKLKIDIFKNTTMVSKYNNWFLMRCYIFGIIPVP